MKENDYDLELPKIVSRVDQVIYYPLHYDCVVNHNGFIEVVGTHSIGSGLIFTKDLVLTFQKHNLKLFDEHYALYGVDVSLFRRMWRLVKQGEHFKLKSSCVLLHSLSRTEGPESKFRRTERLIDFAISVRRYPSLRSYASFIKKGGRQLIGFNFSDIKIMLVSYISGIHPRSKKWKV